MSIATDARSYADSALAQGRSAVAHGRIGLTQGRGALAQAGNALGVVNRRLVADAPKPVYAVLGAADLVAASVTKRAEELPTDAVQGVTKAQHTGQALIVRAQSEASSRLEELLGRLQASREAVSALPETARSVSEGYLTVARSAGEAYLQTAKELFASLTDRGEVRAAELRKDPRLAKLLGQVGDAADSVTPLAKSAFDAVAEPVSRRTVSKPAARTSTARTSAAAKSSKTRSTATKSTATKSSVAKSTAAKAAATKPTARKAPAKKAAGSRPVARKTTASSRTTKA